MKKLVFFLLLLIPHITSAQCAMCKAVVESGNASEAEGLNTGIMYLMVFPYLLVGTIIFFIIRQKRKKKI